MAMVETRMDLRTWKAEFESMNEFYKYICDTPLNDAFRWKTLSSVNNSFAFSHTHSYEEAVELFHNGWDDMAKQLTEKLKVIDKQTQVISKPRRVNSVAGYQANVPRYLQGNPKSMIAKQQQPVKQKIVNITKSIAYSAGATTKQMIEESIKTLQIVKKLEAAGYRVNLNIGWGVKEDRSIFLKVRVKSANERLNISKTAFAMCHPSMLRRLCFRFEEVYPQYTEQFTHGYGIPCSATEMRKAFEKDIVLPAFISFDADKVQTLDDLKGYNGYGSYQAK